MVDPHTELVPIVEPKVKVQTPRHECLKVLRILVLPLVYKRLEVKVRNENHRTVELETLRNIFLTKLRRFLQVRHPTGTGRITERLQDVQRIFIVEDTVGVIQNNHTTRSTVLVRQHIQMQSGQRTTHNLMGGVRVFKNLLNRVRLTDTRRTSDHKGTDVLGDGTLRKKGKNIEPLGQIGKNLIISTNLRLLGLSRSNLRIGRTATLYNSESHVV